MQGDLLGFSEIECSVRLLNVNLTLRLINRVMLDKVTDDYNVVASEDAISSRPRNWSICCSRARISTVVLAKSGT